MERVRKKKKKITPFWEMGICVSTASSEIHDQVDNGQENVTFVEGNIVSHGVKKLCSLYSKQGSKGLNQDAGILCQVCTSCFFLRVLCFTAFGVFIKTRKLFVCLKGLWNGRWRILRSLWWAWKAWSRCEWACEKSVAITHTKPKECSFK